MTLRYLTAGESHGPELTAILEGMPAGVAIDRAAIDRELARRQRGAGSSERMRIERDTARITSGVLAGRTTGAPIAVVIENRDHAAWADRDIPPMTVPRPGHADLAATVKYGYRDLRLGLERASARETAARVAVGALCKQLLAELGVTVGGYVVAIGDVEADLPGVEADLFDVGADLPGGEDHTAQPQPSRRDVYARRIAAAEDSEVRCPDPAASAAMLEAIEAARRAKDTLGGVFEVVALGVPPGLGSHVHDDRRLPGRLLAAVAGIPAVKGAEIGDAFDSARRRGSEVHDTFAAIDGRVVRRTNRGGGTEGGISTGEPLVVRAAMKPISTTLRPMQSVDLATGEPADAR
ncbi:MAG: chorismate synthase, partial [Anaerolineae bacterium]